ncbi:MAG: flavodoxin-dependent (E)-4-hydroxy-3-methylbut-2-enyl-diphosphate synthase [Eubacteriales bacterium]|nr:flavodoxin-dependent (E)-4-hydroxy-3-methylbut-2-enyl-diphosphate synthase [Eubacteriales bacterium]
MTRVVKIGNVKIGGGNPVLIQSMTNTDTRDVEATAAQILALEDAGCQIVRSSVYDVDCARAIPSIKSHIHIPLVADIHFDYRLAIAAMENGVDKIRFNPGNIGDDKHVEQVVACARAHRVPIRIGVNAGSLEKQFMCLPIAEAMVQSALRNVSLLESAGFYDTVISLKSSTVKSTVEAYRRISSVVDYPLHIGVTEAGTREIGEIKSAIGIGSLLLDGIGDTLRVSLTGDVIQEVEAAKKILRALGINLDDVEIVSCPTCGRTGVNLQDAVAFVNANIHHNAGYLKIAVMGCAVNGPGEARDADIGIAFGKGNGVLFERGEQVASGSAQQMLELLVSKANERLKAASI